MQKCSLGDFFLLLICLLLICVACGMAPVNQYKAAHARYILKFNHVLTESEPFHHGLVKWSQRVAERTGGEVEIQVYHSAQLGMEESVIEQMRSGIAIGQLTDAARLGIYVPEIAVLNAPYFFSTIQDAARLSRLPTIRKWKQELEDKYGIKVISSNWVQGMRNLVTNKPIRRPDDLIGLHIRIPPGDVWQQTMLSFGANPVILPFGEIYLGMERGHIDGADLVYCNITEAKLFEIARYVSETSHIYLINFQVVSRDFYDNLPPDYQRILIEEAERAGLEASRKMEQDLHRVKKQLALHGMKIVEDVNTEAFERAGEKVYLDLGLTRARKQIYREMSMCEEM